MGISDLIQDLIPLQAVFLNVLIMVGHVDVTTELVLGMVVVGTPPLRIDASSIRLSITANDESQRSCDLLTASPEIPVAEGIKVPAHEINLEVGA